MNHPNIPDDFFLTHGKEVEQLFGEAVRAEMLRHKKLGNAIATWRDGEAVILPPEEIPVEIPAATNNGKANGKHS